MSDSEVSGLKGWNAGIPVNRSSDKWGLTVFGIDSGTDLIVKTHQKIFPSYHCFQAQRIYYITIAVSSYEHGAENRGATSSSFRRGATFMKFHSMTSSCLFNRGTNFSQTSQIKFSSQHFQKSEFFTFNQYADQRIRTEKIISLMQTLDSVLN